MVEKRTAKMENYAFVDAMIRDKWIDPKTYSDKYSLMGNTDREELKNEEFVKTSAIAEFYSDRVFTISGTKYELGQMNKDYKEYLDAKDAGIPVLKCWTLMGCMRKGYIIHGEANGRIIERKVVSQDGNFLCLDDGIKYFVMWFFGFDLLFNQGDYLDMKIEEDFEEICGKRCRPKLF